MLWLHSFSILLRNIEFSIIANIPIVGRIFTLKMYFSCFDFHCSWSLLLYFASQLVNSLPFSVFVLMLGMTTGSVLHSCPKYFFIMTNWPISSNPIFVYIVRRWPSSYDIRPSDTILHIRTPHSTYFDWANWIISLDLTLKVWFEAKNINL